MTSQMTSDDLSHQVPDGLWWPLMTSLIHWWPLMTSLIHRWPPMTSLIHWLPLMTSLIRYLSVDPQEFAFSPGENLLDGLLMTSW